MPPLCPKARRCPSQSPPAVRGHRVSAPPQVLNRALGPQAGIPARHGQIIQPRKRPFTHPRGRRNPCENDRTRSWCGDGDIISAISNSNLHIAILTVTDRASH